MYRKGKGHHPTGYKAHRGSRGTDILAPGWVGWSMQHPSCFTPGRKTWYPFYRSLAHPGSYKMGTRADLDRYRKSLPPLGFNPGPVQPIASHRIQIHIIT